MPAQSCVFNKNIHVREQLVQNEMGSFKTSCHCAIYIFYQTNIFCATKATIPNYRRFQNLVTDVLVEHFIYRAQNYNIYGYQFSFLIDRTAAVIKKIRVDDCGGAIVSFTFSITFSRVCRPRSTEPGWY